jgi:hypothetical protein
MKTYKHSLKIMLLIWLSLCLPDLLTFKGLAQAKKMNGKSGRGSASTTGDSFRSGEQKVFSQPIQELDRGSVSGNTYTNRTLGFSYQFPAGWHVADEAAQAAAIESGHEAAWGADPEAAREHETLQRCSRILLMATKYPEGTAALNPVSAISALDRACFPATKFPVSIDDREGVREFSAKFSDFFQNMPFPSDAKPNVTTRMLQGQLLIAFSSSMEGHVEGRKAPLRLHTSLVVTPLKNYWIIWMLMSDEADWKELQNMKTTFLAGAD